MNQEILDKVKELQSQGLGSEKIALKLGLTKRIVLAAYKELNLFVNKVKTNTLNIEQNKRCTLCNIIKPIFEFDLNYYDKYDRCKICSEKTYQDLLISAKFIKRKGNIITEELIIKIKNLMLEHKTSNEITNTLNIENGIVYRIIRKLDGSKYKQNEDIDLSLLSSIKLMIDKDKRSYTIAKELNIDVSIINKTIRKYNLKYNPITFVEITYDFLEQVKTLYDKNFSQYKMTSILNCNASTISRAFNDLGLYKPKININKDTSFNIKMLINKNIYINEICNLLQIDKSIVLKYMQENNIKIYHEKDITRDLLNKVIDSFNNKQEIYNISNNLNISTFIIKKIYKELNIINKNKIFITNNKTCPNCKIIKTINDFNVPCFRCIMCQDKYEKSLIDDENKKKNHIHNRKSMNQIKRIVASAIRSSLDQKFEFRTMGEVLNYLPYNDEQLRDHIQSLFSSSENLYNGKVWMNWENHGVYNKSLWKDDDLSTWTWQVDHIIPNSKFNYTNMIDEDFRKAWSLSNLRPYSAKLNIKEGNRR